MELRWCSGFWTVLSLWTYISVINGFNIDVGPSKIIHQAPGQSWFGYDVDIYQDDRDTWVLVGAPKAQTSQPGVRRGGAVFRCSTETESCGEIQFDREGHTKRLNGSEMMQIDSKSDQWFGATVSTSKKGDSVVACAPRYIYFYSTFDKREPVGTCYFATDHFEQITEYSPCRLETYRNQRTYGYHRLGYCMAGFSAAVTENSDKLFLGAPGAWYSQGSVIVQNTDEAQNRLLTEEGPPHMDDTYLGYATAVGDFNGDGVDDAALSIPRGNDMTGMVALFDFGLHSLLNISGEQVGSYFGASLAVTDLNGDGRDDLIIGAPLYIEYTSDKGLIKAKYEVGKVYIYFGYNYRQQDMQSVVGQNEWSRFGYSVAGAGDLNADGYNDFIVGAPYDGNSRKGAVYVFHGDKKGILPKHTQVIEAETVHPSLTTFGFSVAGGRDVDGNTYPDIVVGAYKANKAVLLKSKPVVSVKGTIKVSRDIISLDDEICPDPSNSQFYPCAKATICLSYTGRGAPPKLKLDLSISLDAKKGLSARTFFLGSDVSKMLVQVDMVKEKQWCEKYDFFVKGGIRDKLSPIVIEANYSIAEGSKAETTGLQPVVDATQPASISGKVEIEKDCGPDKICIPDLQLMPSVDVDSFVIGSEDNLILDIKVKNTAEAAYESQFFLTVPAGLEFTDHKSDPEKKGSLPVTCSPPEEYEVLSKTENYNIICDIGNPLPKDKQVHFTFEFSTKNVDPSTGVLQLQMSVNSTNDETDETLEDNEKILDIPVEVQAQLVITGVAKPEEYNYDKEDYRDFVLPPTDKRPVFDTDVGELVEHRYEVINLGPSSVHGAIVKIYWPSFTQNKQHLLYLIDDPITHGDVKCRVKQQANVNKESLTIVKTDRNTSDVQSLYLYKRMKRSPQEEEAEEKEEETEAETVESSVELSRAFRRLIDKVKSANKIGQAWDYTGTLNKMHVDCNKLNCTEIECEIGLLEDQERVLIRVQSRLWVNTLIDEAFYDASISSVAIAKITSLPYAVDIPTQSTVVRTRVNPKDPRVVRRSIPFWLWLIAILAGITFLILLILLLWRIGFFKRKRPPRGQALLQKPPDSEYYGFSGYSSGYAPQSMYSEAQHGPRV